MNSQDNNGGVAVLCLSNKELWFTPEQFEAVKYFTNEYLTADHVTHLDLPKTDWEPDGVSIPLIHSRQLNPYDLLIEMLNPSTSNERRFYIAKAFYAAFRSIKQMNLPPDRFLFIQEDHSPEICIWLD